MAIFRTALLQTWAVDQSDRDNLVAVASACFERVGWALPPAFAWDVTDFGLGDWRRFGLVLVTLANEPEYCEKIMFALRGMVTPWHHHRRKKEDIICRHGELEVSVRPASTGPSWIKHNGERVEVASEMSVVLRPGERVTLLPLTPHTFVPVSDDCVVGEVSTANDDVNDNFFEDGRVLRHG